MYLSRSMLDDAIETLTFLREFRVRFTENDHRLDDAIVSSCILIIEQEFEIYLTKNNA